MRPSRSIGLVFLACALSSCAQWKSNVTPIVRVQTPGMRIAMVRENVTLTLAASVCPDEVERQDVTVTNVNRRGAVRTRTVTQVDESIGYNVAFRVGFKF